MKKRIISLLLVLALLPAGGALAAGTAEDPLISKSYTEESFIPQLYGSLRTTLAESVEAELSRRASAPLMEQRSLRIGSALELSEGQSFILISGSAELEFINGAVADVSRGTELEGGLLPAGSRCIVCEKGKVRIEAKSPAVMLLPHGVEVEMPHEKPLVSPFTDVVAGVWWHDDIVKAYNRGLVNGMTPTTFEPRGNLTLIQAIKLAACMHQLYTEGSVSLKNSPVHPWYQSYVDYALEHGIIDSPFSDYKASATRRQFIEIFARALPESEFTAINNIPHGSIGDVRSSEDWADTVYIFYRAGILTGYTANGVYNAHDFGPESFITRAEVATIMNRMFDPEARVSFSIQ